MEVGLQSGLHKSLGGCFVLLEKTRMFCYKHKHVLTQSECNCNSTWYDMNVSCITCVALAT
jgi:hypothetical protein